MPLEMSEKQLRRLSRQSLLELLLEKTKECDSLKEQLEQARQELASRKLVCQQTGNLAQAALELNKVFEAAQAAAEQYLENVKENAQSFGEKEE